MTKKWICQLCGHEHEDEPAPDECPVCGAHRWRKYEEEEEED